MSRYRRSPGTIEHSTAVLFMFLCFAFPKMQDSLGSNFPTTLIPILALVALVFASLGWPNSLCWLFTFFMHIDVFILIDIYIFYLVSFVFAHTLHLIGIISTPATQMLWVLICWLKVNMVLFACASWILFASLDCSLLPINKAAAIENFFHSSRTVFHGVHFYGGFCTINLLDPSKYHSQLGCCHIFQDTHNTS